MGHKEADDAPEPATEEEAERRERLGRTVYITGSVDDTMAMIAVEQLEDLDCQDGAIRIVLNSEGGDEQAGYAIHDAITMCRNFVTIEGYGSIMSIAAAIFQAGDRRLLTPNALFMIHNGVIGEEIENQDQVLAEAERIKRHNERYYRILANASGQTHEQIQNWCKGESYFMAQEAVDAGFADAIIQPLKQRPRGKRKRSKKS